jgi:8-oxo-dGTP pyrophosphatase MutT (NUDIX family)
MTRVIEPGEKHLTATVVIITDSVPAKTLLQHHRKFDKWMPPGGHQESSENSVEAAIRETLEETGIDISSVIPPARDTHEDVLFLAKPNYLLEEKIPAFGDQPTHYHLDQVYVVTVPEQAVERSTAESHDIGWFTLAETETMNCFNDMHEILRQELTP